MAGASWLRKLANGAASLVGLKSIDSSGTNPVSDRGILVFANTSEVIAAERALQEAGFEVKVKGPPPDLQTGCDMVVVFPVLKQAAVEKVLKEARLEPEKIITEADALLDPVSLYQVKDLGRWLMIRAANMKITIDKETGIIVNISGGGCPDVPWLAQQTVGKKFCEAPRPISIGHTLCCYSLQKAYDELKRIRPCG